MELSHLHLFLSLPHPLHLGCNIRLSGGLHSQDWQTRDRNESTYGGVLVCGVWTVLVWRFSPPSPLIKRQPLKVQTQFVKISTTIKQSKPRYCFSSMFSSVAFYHVISVLYVLQPASMLLLLLLYCCCCWLCSQVERSACWNEVYHLYLPSVN